MGIVEHLLEAISAKAVGVFAVGALVSYLMVASINEKQRLKKLGGEHAPVFLNYVPFGTSLFLLLPLSELPSVLPTVPPTSVPSLYP